MKFITLTIYLLLFSSQLFAEDSCKGIDKSLWNNCYGHQLYDSGKIYNKVFYKNGRKDGEDYRYFENGKIQSKGFYNNGKLEGKNISFDQNGNILKEIFICEGSNTANWKNCTGIFFVNEIQQNNCVFSIYMNTKIYMGISYKDIGFYTYPPCEMFVGEWKNGKQIGEGKYMYWATKDDGYSEAKYQSGTLLKIEKKFTK